jgi:hypothetical protein
MAPRPTPVELEYVPAKHIAHEEAPAERGHTSSVCSNQQLVLSSCSTQPAKLNLTIYHDPFYNQHQPICKCNALLIREMAALSISPPPLMCAPKWQAARRTHDRHRAGERIAARTSRAGVGPWDASRAHRFRRGPCRNHPTV